MSIIKSIKQVLGLGPAAESHHWDGSVPNQLSLKRGTPEAPGTELLKALNGILSFPNQGQSLAENGYVKLPGGLIIQWGQGAVGVGGSAITLPVATTIRNTISASFANDGPSIGATCNVGFIGNTSFSVWCFNATGVAIPGYIHWIAIGY